MSKIHPQTGAPVQNVECLNCRHRQSPGLKSRLQRLQHQLPYRFQILKKIVETINLTHDKFALLISTRGENFKEKKSHAKNPPASNVTFCITITGAFGSLPRTGLAAGSFTGVSIPKNLDPLILQSIFRKQLQHPCVVF